MRYVIIEQAEEGEAYITHINAKNIDYAFDKYNDVNGGNIIILNENSFYAMCMRGCGV